LKAGVMDDGRWFETEEGTPQGSVMTPRTQKVTWVRPWSGDARGRNLRSV
jgi:hypothetical protein